MLPTRSGEIAGLRDGDRSGVQRVDDRVAETQDRVGKEHPIVSDANDVASLGDRDKELEVDPELALERAGARRLERLAVERRASAGPLRLLIGGQ